MYNLTENIVTFLPPDSIEPQAKQQLITISEMPFVFHHLAVMPDCHLGKGATVGSVIATNGAIIPAAVGVDVGCGMVAVKTKFFANDLPDNLDKLRAGIERRIPLGAGAGNKKLTDTAIERITELKSIATQDYEKVDKHWITALGSLGSGNHFIEICLDENDQVWVALHSGSRGIGNRLATKHIKIAQRLMEEESITLKERDMDYRTENTNEFDAYMTD